MLLFLLLERFDNDTCGGFTKDVYSLLVKDKKLIHELADILYVRDREEKIRGNP